MYKLNHRNSKAIISDKLNTSKLSWYRYAISNNESPAT